jgi:D-sedoheptulose 7-phosphate isomerase
MKESTYAILMELEERYPALAGVKEDVFTAFEVMKECYEKGGCLYVCGNGGSTSDSEHIVGELMKCFKKPRAIDKTLADNLAAEGELGLELIEYLEGGLPAISLCGHPALTFAYLNDTNPMLTFAQQLSVLGRAGDVLLTLSTSGNSKNCVNAAEVAKCIGMNVLSMTGAKPSKLSEISDCTVKVPETETFKVQEYHLPVYHYLCAMTEKHFFE